VRAQAARNYHAMLAARALARLAGLPPPGAARPGSGAPPCEPARAALGALLTPALAARLADPDPRALLVDLNSSILNPQVPLPAQPCPAMQQYLFPASTLLPSCASLRYGSSTLLRDVALKRQHTYGPNPTSSL
jgi:hypothetical protein